VRKQWGMSTVMPANHPIAAHSIPLYPKHGAQWMGNKAGVQECSSHSLAWRSGVEAMSRAVQLVAHGLVHCVLYALIMGAGT